MGRDGTSTRRDVPVPCMFRTARNGFVDSDTRSARHRMCATARACVRAVRHFRRRAGETDSRILPLSGARVLPLREGDNARRKGEERSRAPPRTSNCRSYAIISCDILPRLVSAAREYLGPARASRRESAAVWSVRRLCLGCLERQRCTVESRARARARLAQAVSGYVNDPQPGVVRELYPWTAMCVRNVDVHVSCSSHVDAQLAAFFIDPRAK